MAWVFHSWSNDHGNLNTWTMFPLNSTLMNMNEVGTSSRILKLSNKGTAEWNRFYHFQAHAALAPRIEAYHRSQAQLLGYDRSNSARLLSSSPFRVRPIKGMIYCREKGQAFDPKSRTIFGKDDDGGYTRVLRVLPPRGYDYDP
jgi:hypothetical protein